MDTLILDLKILISQYLDFDSKIKLFMTSKSYNFILQTINKIPTNKLKKYE